jgi:protein disulfide-isomerase A6
MTDCKKLAPVWEDLARDFANEPTVVIAKVNAEAPNAKSVAESHQVSSYPTIKYFHKGSTKPEDYTGGRGKAELINYINEKAGTYRAPGGGLTVQGGTIAVLDAIVAKYNEASDSFKKGVDEARKAANGLQDKYAEYYVKVFEKMGSNKDYADKELTRLQGLLKKGGLAPEKVDDLTARSNILRKFIPTKEKQEL